MILLVTKILKYLIFQLSKILKKMKLVLSNKKYLNLVETTKAGALIIEKKYASKKNKNYLFSNDPYFLLAELASFMYPESIYPNFYFDKNDSLMEFDSSVNVSDTSFIHKTAKIGNGCSIGHNSVIGKGVVVGIIVLLEIMFQFIFL